MLLRVPLPPFGVRSRFSPQAHWGVNGKWSCVYLQCAVWWFHKCPHCEMITTFELMSTSVTSHHDLFFSFGGNRTIYSLSIFQAYNTAWVPWSKFQWEQSIPLLGLTAYSAIDVTCTQYSLWAAPNQYASWVHCSPMFKGLFESSAQGRGDTRSACISSAHAHAPLLHQTPLTKHKVSDKVSKIMKKGTASEPSTWDFWLYRLHALEGGPDWELPRHHVRGWNRPVFSLRGFTCQWGRCPGGGASVAWLRDRGAAWGPGDCWVTAEWQSPSEYGQCKEHRLWSQGVLSSSSDCHHQDDDLGGGY